MKTLKTLELKFQIKETSAEGSFNGYASTFGNLDLGGDIVAPGAFAKTIKDRQDHPILLNHNTRAVIGVNKSYREDAHGLYVEGQLVLGSQGGRDAYELMKAGALTGLSIGYDTVVDEMNWDTGVRTLKEVKLWEYSLTAFPMNEAAQVTSVKSFDRFTAEIDSLLALLKSKKRLTPERLAYVEHVIKEFSALRAEQCSLEAATQDDHEPSDAHSGFGTRTDSILERLSI
jgi:HK97 family phage prohead protease